MLAELYMYAMELNDKHKKWVARLLKTLNAMPPGIEICVTYSGSVHIMEEGESARYQEETGHLDNPGVIETIYPKKSVARRIDGRDSMI